MDERICANLEGRAMFTQPKPHHFMESAALLTKCGPDSWETISRLTVWARKYRREDIRKAHRLNQLSLINGIFRLYEMGNARSSPSTKENALK